MDSMGEMPMPGGWSMSMMWMRMPGQTWPGTAAAFLAMWVAMMAVMMLPPLTPMLWRYRAAAALAGKQHLLRLTAVVAGGYFFVWAVLGLIVFLLGSEFAGLALQRPAVARAVPLLAGLVVLAGSALQFTRWKAQRLVRCQETPLCDCQSEAGNLSAWRYGLRIGLRCSYCCAGFTAILLATGVMDLRAMAVVTAAIGLERLSPVGERVARATGALGVAAGLLMIIGTIPASILAPEVF
jgi:predicted metal-binding membrane protein